MKGPGPRSSVLAGAGTGGTPPARDAVLGDHLLRYGDRRYLNRLIVGWRAMIAALLMPAAVLALFAVEQYISALRGSFILEVVFLVMLVGWVALTTLACLSLAVCEPRYESTYQHSKMRYAYIALAAAAPVMAFVTTLPVAHNSLSGFGMGALVAVVWLLWIALGTLTLRRLERLSTLVGDNGWLWRHMRGMWRSFAALHVATMAIIPLYDWAQAFLNVGHDAPMWLFALAVAGRLALMAIPLLAIVSSLCLLCVWITFGVRLLEERRMMPTTGTAEPGAAA